MQLAAGRKIDRYVIGPPIGEGASAVVYAARHESLGTDHAIKVLTRATPEITRRLLAEGRAQAHLRHPNIVNVTDIIEIDGQPGLVMEQVRGPSLTELLARGRLPLDRVDALARPILEGVRYAHDHGVLHRDLKPDNILVGLTPAGPVPKILDFGLVKFVSNNLQVSTYLETVGNVPMGTPYYMAPEQFDPDQVVTGATDVWSLGVLLYEMTTGERPFRATNILELAMAIGTGTHRPVDELRPDLPDRYRRAIEGALQKDPAQRWASPHALFSAWIGAAEISPANGASPQAEDPWTTELRRIYTGEDKEPPPRAFDAAAETIDPGSDWQNEVDTSEVPKALPDAEPEALTPPTTSPMVPAVLGALGAIATLAVVGLGALLFLQSGGPDQAQVVERPPPETSAVPPVTVSVQGVDPSFVRLKDDRGLHTIDQPVPAGVYEVLLRDEHGEEHVALPDLALVSGQSRTLRCKPKSWTCR